MKIKSLITGLLLSSVAASASVTISGTSLLSSDILGYSTGLYLASDTGSFDESLFISLDSGVSFTAGTTIGDYTVLGTGAINAAGPFGALNAGVTFTAAQGLEIGILTFASSSTSSSAGDTFFIYTDDWLVPADGANAPLTSTGAPYQGAYAETGTVVPEPSAYATLAGLVALGFVMLRRRG
tara:strand:+ start:381 stop:926 length:546 start_codon:yes stop_codon:yes gene_type:complete